MQILVDQSLYFISDIGKGMVNLHFPLNVKIQDLVEKVGLDRTIFKPIFDSHIQVLFRDIHDKQFCLRLTSKGLIFSNLQTKKSYLVKENIGGQLQLEFDEENTKERKMLDSGNRNYLFGYIEANKRNEKYSNVVTRELNLHQIINIAYKKVYSQRDITGDFKSPHFVFECIKAVADEKCKSMEINGKKWPEIIHYFDAYFNDEETTAFKQVVDNIGNKYKQINDEEYKSRVTLKPETKEKELKLNSENNEDEEE